MDLYDIIDMFKNYKKIAWVFANDPDALEEMFDLISQREEVSENIDLHFVLTGEYPEQELRELDFVDNQIRILASKFLD